MNSIHIGTTLLGRCDGTFTTVRRERRQVLQTNDDRYCLARNTGERTSTVVHRGREFALRPGSMVLLKLDEPFFTADGTEPQALHQRASADGDAATRWCPMSRTWSDASSSRAARCRWRWTTASSCCTIPPPLTKRAWRSRNHLLDLAALGLGARGELALTRRSAAACARSRLKAVPDDPRTTLYRAGFFRAETRRRGRPVGALRQRTALRGRCQLHDAAERAAAAQGRGAAGAGGAPHQRYRLRVRLQRSVLFQPLLPPPLRADADAARGK